MAIFPAWPLARWAMGPGRDQPLPATLQDLAEVIGRGPALRLADCVHGRGPLARLTGFNERPRTRRWRRHVHIPERISAEHWLADALGSDLAQRLAASHGRMILEIPSCQRLRIAQAHWMIGRLAALGVDRPTIARLVGVTPRTVQAVLQAETAPEGTGGRHA